MYGQAALTAVPKEKKPVPWATLGEVLRDAHKQFPERLHWVSHYVGPGIIVLTGALNAGLSVADLWDTYARIPFS